jgi:hypothetical protein
MGIVIRTKCWVIVSTEADGTTNVEPTIYRYEPYVNGPIDTARPFATVFEAKKFIHMYGESDDVVTVEKGA